MSQNTQKKSTLANSTLANPSQEPPWYRQFWPWFIIALPASAVIASFITLWLAISNPVQLVIEDDEYQRLNSELKAQPAVQKPAKDSSDETDSGSG